MVNAKRALGAVIAVVVVAQFGCSGTPPLGVKTWNGVRFSAIVEVRSDSVVYALSVFNTTRDVVTLRTSCDNPGTALIVRDAYDTEDRWSELALRQQQGCFPFVNRVDLPGEQSLDLRRALPVGAILGDTLPPGLYKLIVRLSYEEPVPSWKIPVGNYHIGH